MYLLVGIGNDDDEYRETFHNLGQRAAMEWRVGRTIETTAEYLDPDCYEALTLVGSGDNRDMVISCINNSYMNNCGEFIKEKMEYWGVDPGHLIVLYDDLDMMAGEYWLRPYGHLNKSKHKGLKSIAKALDSTNFWCAGIGINQEGLKAPRKQYVLSTIPEDLLKSKLIPAISHLLTRMEARIALQKL